MIEATIPPNVELQLGEFTQAVNAIPDPILKEKAMKALTYIEELYSAWQHGIPKAQQMRLEGLEDLIVMALSASDQTIPVIYRFNENGTQYYLMWIVIHDVYDKRGVPLVVYTSAEKVKANYIIYDHSQVRFADKRSDRSTDFSFRVVRVASLPDFLKVS